MCTSNVVARCIQDAVLLTVKPLSGSFLFVFVHIRYKAETKTSQCNILYEFVECSSLLQVIEPSIGDGGETIAILAIKVSVESVFSRLGLESYCHHSLFLYHLTSQLICFTVQLQNVSLAISSQSAILFC